MRRACLAVLAAGALTACGVLGSGGSSTPGEGAGLEPRETTESAEPSPRPSPAPVEPPSSAPAAPSPSPSPAPPDPPAPAAPTPSTPPATPPSPAPAPPPAPEPSTPAREIPTAWLGQDVEVLPTTEPVVALTFDGGSSDAAATSILATLDRYGVRATFFVTGDFARRYPAALRSMHAAGHPVGNHSDTHAHYPELRNVEIRADLAAAEAAITAATGVPARPLFRFPYGDRTALDIEVVNDAGYVPFRWTVDSLGWQGTSGGRDAAEVTERVLATARRGQIVLMHVGAHPTDGSRLDADALPGIIEGLRARGYDFVALDEVLDP